MATCTVALTLGDVLRRRVVGGAIRTAPCAGATSVHVPHSRQKTPVRSQVGHPRSRGLLKEIKGASDQPLLDPHQIVETERIGDDSITALLVTDEMRFEVTVFRAGDVEYALAVQTEGRAPIRSSRNLARQLADAILRSAGE